MDDVSYSGAAVSGIGEGATVCAHHEELSPPLALTLRLSAPFRPVRDRQCAVRYLLDGFVRFTSRTEAAQP